MDHEPSSVRSSLRSRVGAEALDALLRAPERAVVGFDFDGTLAPIVADPDQARAHPRALTALQGLARHVGTLAVVTGRPAQKAVDYTGLAGAEGLEGLVVLGHYGLERWEPGTGEVVRPPLPPGVAQVRDELPAIVAELAPDAHIEDKGAALAVHTRRSAAPQQAFEALRTPLAALAERAGLTVEPGRLVIELRPRGMDKGAALRGLVSAVPGQGASAVAFFGDDLGDLAAFAAVREMRGQGLPGLLVCSGSDEVEELARQADVVVDGPAGVVAWLESLAAALGHQG